MRIYLLVCFFSIFTIAIPQQKTDSLRTKLKTTASVSLNSNGIASIPAFSLGKPAVIASLSLVKNRFSYDPTLAYGLDLRPWIIDNWLHYILVRKSLFELTAGFDFSLFGSRHILSEGSIWEEQRYFTFSISGVFITSTNSTVTVAYWNDRGQEKGTLIGNYFDLEGARSGFNIGRNVSLSTALQIFYIDYTGLNDGLFVSPKLSFTVKNIPFAIFCQAIQTLQSNISPYPDFRWNIGLAYTL
jgi:hypothetical protein